MKNIQSQKMAKYMPTDNKVKVDQNGVCIYINNISGLVRIDGVPVFKIKAAQTGEIVLQFSDLDKYRSIARGTRYIEVPLEMLIDKIKASY
jgi:hypothetical protein